MGEKIKNYALWGCASREIFKQTEKRLRAFNYSIWRVISTVCGVYFTLLTLTSSSVNVVRPNFILYAGMAAVSVTVSLLLNLKVNSDSPWLMPVLYLMCAALIVFSIILGAVFSPVFLAVTFHVLLIALPLFLVDRPWRTGLLQLAAALLFSILVLRFKSGETAELDLFNALVFAIIGLFINFYMAHSRVQQFHMAELLEISSITDDLTGLYNRKEYSKDLSALEKRKNGSPFVYAAMDVNGLKLTNDSLGHVAGDELINGAAQCIKNAFPASAKVYRIGGDEFAALLYSGGLTADALKERLVESTAAWHGSKVSSLTISCGFVSHEECEGMKAEEIIHLADKRMYEEKAQYYRLHDRRRR